MKYVNFYSAVALMLIVSLAGSLGATTGELAPPLIVGALLLTVLVMGWAGGASDARHEVDRLTRLESGRQLLAQSHIKQRDQLEEALARLQLRIEEVTASNAGLRKVAEREAAEVERLFAQVEDSQAAIEVFTAAQAGNMVRITALEGENAELRARTTAEVAAVSWPLQPFAIVIGRAMGSDDLELAMFDGVNYCFSDGDCYGRDGDTLDGFTAEFLTQHQLEQRLIVAHLDAGSVAVLQAENAELRKPLLALLDAQPLIEPVYISKALMAHREARVVLDGGTGPVAAVHLVNIGLTGWVYTKETAEAYARGWNSGVRALRGALTEAVVGKLLPTALGGSLVSRVGASSECACRACLRANGSE